MTLRQKLRYFRKDGLETDPDIEIDGVVNGNSVIVPDYPQGNFQPGDFFAFERDERVNALRVIGPAIPETDPESSSLVWKVPVKWAR